MMGLEGLIGGVAGGESVGRSGTGLTKLSTVFNSINISLKIIMAAILVVMALACTFYAIWIAIKLGKAEDEGKRKEAKNHLVWAIIGAISAVFLFTLMTTVFASSNFNTYQKEININTDDTDAIAVEVQKQVNTVLGYINDLVGILAGLVTIGLAIFAGYIAFKLITASDESKRKNAKQMLIWTLVAALGVIVLINIINSVMYDTLIKNALGDVLKAPTS